MFDRRTCRLRSFAGCEEGAAMIEYALLIGAIGLALSGAVSAVGGELQHTLAEILALLRQASSSFP
jgi:Flp pilus assembly pilin Flp